MKKDPTEFRQRFAQWKNGEKPYENGLPKYAGGKVPEYVQAGKDSSWVRVTNDPMGTVFQDLVVRPQSRGGNTTVGNWKRQWSLKGEPGLELVSPEFDIISGIRGIGGMLPKKSTTITSKNAIKITPKQWDDAYMSAINNNDIAEAQRLRDLHFKIKTPNNKAVDVNGNPIKQYHTVSDEHDPNFNTFNTTIEGENSSIYTSDDPFLSGTYSSKLVSEAERDHIIETTRKMHLASLKRITNPSDFDIKQIKLYADPKKARKKILSDHQWLNGKIYSNQQKQLYSYIENPVIIDNYGKDWAHLSLSNLPNDVFKNIRVDIRGGLGDWYSTRSLEKAIEDLNYDGAIIKNIADFGGRKRYFSPDVMNSNSTVYQIKKPTHIKYADPVTYDDAGKIIPLSQRDNFNISDLRYAIVPTVFGSSIAYQSHK